MPPGRHQCKNDHQIKNEKIRGERLSYNISNSVLFFTE